ncbi:acyl-CoA dehydrogenase family protein [Actinomadura sp. KC216]|uniref:acyl-CoA dehydrogenase family protein n=1 Tax=Actinomadura sp. KC216 TaxID=2530370 RepID=UPI001FB8101A|nr:acyl-CoA dehydrogenase family protein [Actinomadura sp. KC216]
MSREEDADLSLWGDPRCPPDVRPLRERVAGFVRERVIPCEPRLDSDGALRERLRREARKAGLWGLPLPAELGGAGLALTGYAHIAEAEGASDHGPDVLGSTVLLDVTTLTEHAPPAVRDRYLSRIASGELSLCNAMTEPGSPGSDPALTTTRAEQRPDGSWTVHGRKWFITGAGHADLALVLARTSGGPPARTGLSVLLVPTSAPGFEVVRELPVLGAGGQWELALDGVTVPADHLLGDPGHGLRVLAGRVRLGRLLRCLRWLGQAERAFTLMRDRARSRPAASGRLGDHQLVQQLVFDALLAIRTTRPLVFETAARIEAGHDARIETGLAKVAAARTLQRVTDAAIQVHGAAGLGPDTPLPALFRTGRMARVLDGPDELHITAVARRVLR